MKSESETLKRVQLAGSRLDLVLFRNHTGAIKSEEGRWHRMGLCKGSADLIGWHRKTGQFVAIEVKRRDGRLSKEQAVFLQNVNKSGGIGICCNDETKLEDQLNDHQNTRQH